MATKTKRAKKVRRDPGEPCGKLLDLLTRATCPGTLRLYTQRRRRCDVCGRETL